jgi:uncharacterized protein (TIGR02453 family)
MFTSKTLSFLRSLKRNNSREWFHARRDQYETHCRQPMIDAVERLGEDLRGIAPEMLFDPKVCLLRPFRDTRFSEDKTPLKTHIGATVPNRALGRMNGAGFYFEIAPGWVWIGGGLWRPDTSQLQLVREHVAENHKRLTRIISSPHLKKIGGLQGDRLTRVPRGFAKDHPAADYLQHRQFMAFREEAATMATSKTFYRQLRSTLETIAPLIQFLNEPLVASLQTHQRPHLMDEPAAVDRRDRETGYQRSSALAGSRSRDVGYREDVEQY